MDKQEFKIKFKDQDSIIIMGEKLEISDDNVCISSGSHYNGNFVTNFLANMDCIDYIKPE